MIYVCTACGFIYDEDLGDPDRGIAPGTNSLWPFGQSVGKKGAPGHSPKRRSRSARLAF